MVLASRPSLSEWFSPSFCLTKPKPTLTQHQSPRWQNCAHSTVVILHVACLFSSATLERERKNAIGRGNEWTAGSFRNIGVQTKIKIWWNVKHDTFLCLKSMPILSLVRRKYMVVGERGAALLFRLNPAIKIQNPLFVCFYLWSSLRHDCTSNVVTQIDDKSGRQQKRTRTSLLAYSLKIFNLYGGSKNIRGHIFLSFLSRLFYNCYALPQYNRREKNDRPLDVAK